ncbi:hypothetical protein [Schleiferia thermophila]|jgi:hypothetical protein|uniref:Uncharacterized protein n=1 Tax=Schleiferia thermophila TaxID=884107 RepID=A0A369A630_9FLAO|nr:hypothetical protein [Schleiferia thermophila]KFD38397.1 hypothetical protein AT05_10500 [Schleiferia thermophila str. Yellowstone]PMB23688.1 hypothetical protein CEN47_18525 [Fischerella thermalis CCMEE 5319]RCX04800.1 hypothetical protein DES35_10170 [Schleiferia thermophila]GCD79672.1 hypothetical protein JCM30197_09190 [Schleiferia thermophila]
MTAIFIALFLFIVTTFSLFVLYFFKVYWHLKLLQHQQSQKKQYKTKPVFSPIDLVIFDWKNPEERAIRSEALLMYPLLFPVDMAESDDEKSIRIKKTIKHWNIAIYLALIALFLSYIYLQKSGKA